jgi:4,5-dihydroxyphthalate decarboxylase
MDLPKYLTVTRTQGNNRALKDGTVSPRTFTFDFQEVDPLVAAFRRMVRAIEFDICEMAITTYITARHFRKPFIALPIFLVRGFHHGAIVYNTKSGITNAKDLEGKQVGVNRGYTVTTGVWARAVLQEEYGVNLDRVTWVCSSDEHVTEYRPPANVVSMASGKTLAEMLISGEIAAAIGIDVDHPNVEPLIPDAFQTGIRALRQRGYYPINHLIVVKEELLAAHDDLAADLFEAFSEAKRRYVRALATGQFASLTPVDEMYRAVMNELGDPLPYGIGPNRKPIESLIDHAVAQHIIPSRVSVEGLFAAEALDVIR